MLGRLYESYGCLEDSIITSWPDELYAIFVMAKGDTHTLGPSSIGFIVNTKEINHGTFETDSTLQSHCDKSIFY